MKKLLGFVGVLSVVAMAAGCTATVEVDDTPRDDATLTIANDSSYILDELYVTNVASDSWGPNLIGGSLEPGDSVIVGVIDCGRYDVLVTDETGLDCELSNISLCFSDQIWVVDDNTLDACAFGKPQVKPATASPTASPATN